MEQKDFGCSPELNGSVSATGADAATGGSSLPLTAAAILRIARDVIANGWAQHAMSLDAYGDDCDLYSKEACRFCAVGALAIASGPVSEDDDEYEEETPSTRAASFLRRVIGRESIVMWNDDASRTKDEVLSAFDRAISLAEGASHG